MSIATLSPTPRREYTPMEGSELALHRMLDAMFEESDAEKKRIDARADRNLAYVLGDQWQKSRPEGLAQITANQLWRVVHQSAALLTDTKPTFEITSRPNSDAWEKINRELRKTTEAVLFLNDFDRQLVRMSYDIDIYGNAYSKCYWDPMREWGLGDIGVSRISPRYIWRDPNADSFATSEWILYRVPVSLWEIRRRFDPALAVQVKPDASLSTYTESAARHWWPLPRARRRSKTAQSAVPKAWLEEWWVRDPTLDEHGNPKYPAGRMITRAGRVRLFDARAPYWDPWPGPWVDFAAHQLTDDPYGEPDVSQLRHLQDAYNSLVSIIIDNARFITNGVWIMDEDALPPAERKKLLSRPGAIIAKRRGLEVRRDTGQSLPGQVLEVLNLIKADIQFVSGLMDTGYGRAPKGVTAAAALESLQMATQATIRLKAREIEAGLVRLGQRVVARIFQYYTQTRVLDYLGTSGIEPLTWDPGVLKLAVAQNADEAATMPDLGEEQRQDLLKQFRIRVSPASALALSKERKWATEMALYSAGLIDRQAVLDAIDYPDKEAVMQRMMASEQQRASAGIKAAAGARPRGRGVSITQNILRG